MRREPTTCRLGTYVALCAAAVMAAFLAGGPATTSVPEAEINVSAAVGYQGRADVAAEPRDSDSLVVAGLDAVTSGPVAWSSIDGGTSFTSVALPLTFDGHAFAEGSEPTIAVAPNGTWYAAYEVHDLDGGSNPIDSSAVVARSFDGLVWEALAIVEDNRGAGTDPSAETPHVAVDPSNTGCTPYAGRVQLVWVRKTGTDRAVYRSYSSTGGTSWATKQRINDGVTGSEDVWRPRVAVGPDGMVYVAWLDDLQKTIVIDVSDNGGANFTTDVNAAAVTLGCGTGDCGNDLGCSGGVLHGSTPALAVDASWSASRGKVYIGFGDEIVPANGMDVFAISSADEGATWSSAVQVNSDATRQQYGLALAVQPTSGAVHAAWYDRRADDVSPDCETETWHAVSETGGGVWSDETAVSSLASDYDGDSRGEGTHLALAATGTRVFPVWTDNSLTDHEIYLGRIAYPRGTLIPGGAIETDTTWLAADSPFVVTGDVTVEPGVTLTIEAGVDVRFATCDDTSSGIDGSRIELIVEGILDVAGISGDAVQFVSGDPVPLEGDWYGIRFQDTFESSDSTLRHAKIAHTRYAVRLTNSSPLLEDMDIDKAALNGIRGSARGGIPFSPTRVTVSNAGTPVSLTGVSGVWTDVTLRDSTGDAGSIGGGGLDLRLVGMSVTNNDLGGLTTNLAGGGLEVILSEFNGNGIGEAGLTVDGNGPRTLVANDFQDNLGDGLILNNDTSGWPSAAVYASNFVGNDGMAVRQDIGSLPVDARRNWWGALDGEMGSYPANVSGIWDIHDVATLRHVDFQEKLGMALSNDDDLRSYLVFPDGMNENEMVIYGGAVARAGILRVEVSTDGGTTWSDATVEGAAFSLAWAPTPGIYTLQSRVTDTLSNVQGVPDQKIVTIGSGPTLAGTLLGDETWNGPAAIELIGDVVVPAGTTLTIDAGTTVHAQFLTDATYGGLDPSRIEIIVEGVLVSSGAIGNEVVWDSSRAGAGAQKGDWYGIRYLDTTTDELSIVQATEIAHGVNCLKLEQAAPDVLDSTISNCSQDGISGDSGGLAKALWRLSANTIQDNDGDGIDVVGSTEVEVLGTTITGNGLDGLAIDASPNVVTVTDGTISNNGANGLSIDSGSTGFRLLDSTIQSNGLDGVYVSTGGTNIRLERLLVSDNGEDGIDVRGGTELVLLKSSITGNMRGLYVGSPRLVGAYNTISGNTGEGVDGYEGTTINYSAGAGVPAVVGMSDLDNDVNYEVYLTTNRALIARRNYWGTITTSNMIAAGYPADLAEFWDIHEDGDHGTVDYDNWAPASLASAAPGDLAAHVTWPASGAAVDVHSMIITGVAYARDGIDRVEVCVRRSGDPVCGDGVGDTAYGVVTGKEAWTFEWFPPSSEIFELQVRVVDTSEVKSIPDEAITIDVTLLGATVTGPVAISGPIIADQTWSGEIELTGDVIVEAGTTLTVLAGTDVKARALVDDRLGGEDTSRIELIVRGNLVTQGTLGTPVTFGSAAVVPQRRDWFGLRFESTSDAALNDLDSTRVTAAWHGLEFRQTFSALDDVWSTGNFGIGLNLSSVDATIPSSAITGGSFSDNGSDGIYVDRARGEWLLDGVTLADNGNRGLYFDYCQNDGTLTIDGVEALRNASNGVRLHECSRPVELLASTIDSNTGVGFNARRPTSVVVRANTISNQVSAGMFLTYPGEIIVSKNIFSGNSVNAVVSDSSGQTQLVFNEFGAWTDSNAEGLKFTGGSAATSRNVHLNNFREFAPSTLDLILSNAVAASVNARVNYWDPDTTTEMDLNPFPSNITSIADVEDSAAWGRVDWRAHLGASADLSPGQVCGFTNPVGGDTLTGTTFNIQGAAAADAGIQYVEIAIDDTLTWYPATGAELWAFEWSPPSGNYTLYCRVTDDDGGVQAVLSSVPVTVIAANITTSGTLTTDETWSGVIVLTGDVTVPNGITLTITEGTVVKAMPQSDDQFGGVDTSRIELIIEGTLDLQGSAALPVTFTSKRILPDVPTAGDWYGIRLTDTADSSVTIHDAIIEAGVRGIWGTGGSHQDVDDCVVRDMTDYGIYMDFGVGVRDAADEGMSISGNTVERIGHTGIYLNKSGSHTSWNDSVHRVDGNTVDETGSRAIYVRPSDAERTEVTDNVLSDGYDGISVSGNSNPAFTNHVEVTGNQISEMSDDAFYQYNGRTLLIEGNTITGGFRGIYTQVVPETRVINNVLSGGAGSGVLITGTGDYGYLHRNSVTGYAGDGIATNALNGLVALYNTVSGSGGDAFQLTANGPTAVPRVHWNNIDGSTDYDARVGGGAGADMRRNYWAGTNGEMQAEGYPSDISKIWDIEDYDLRGRVDYRGVENLAIDTNVTLESRFVWPFDGDTLSQRTITLEGTAYADAGVQLVEVSTDGGMTWLPAGGTEFWTYSFTPVADGLQTFHSRVTDADSNVEPSPDATTITFDSTLPTTEGTIPDDETWSGPTPIVLTGDVIVPVGTTLTIDPGTTIRVQPLADNSWGGLDIARVELIVAGTLNLQGSAGSPVTFTSDRMPGPIPGDWYGIRLTDTADSTVTIHDLVVEFGIRGIWSSSGSHQDVVDCVVRDMTTDGIYLQFGNGVRDGGDPGMWVSGNTVERTGGSHFGIYLRRTGNHPSWDDATHLVEGNTTADTGAHGIYAIPNCSELLTLTGNDISNARDGININGTQSTSCTNRIEILDNQISDTGNYGIYQYNGLSSLIDGNTLTGGVRGIRTDRIVESRVIDNVLIGGTGTGILTTSSSGGSEIYVLRNSVTDFGGHGLSSSNLSKLVALYNTIDNVGGDAIAMSVYNAAAVPRIHWNNIQGSTNHDASLSSITGADLRRNYWSGTNGEMLAEGYPAEISEIWDIEDDPSKGRIDYRGVENLAIDTNVTLESRFVWPFGGDVLSSRTITVEGTAFAETGIQLVEVSTDGGTTWLPASGTDFWTFTFTPPADGPQTFLCRVTDVGANVEATPDAVTVTFDGTVPTTEGTLPGNETWSGPGPIVLTGDVVVPAGTLLTIDPGTTILVQPLADNSRGGVDTSRIELIVEGTLIAQGVGPRSIVMTSDSSTPEKGHWYGIRYDGLSRSLPELRALALEWGVKGLSDSNSVGIPDLDLIEIQHMDQHGIHALSAPGGSGDWTMRHVRISQIDEYGAWIDTGAVDASIVIEDFDIAEVGSRALFVGLDGAEELTIRNSAFVTTSNSSTVHVENPGTALLETVKIEHPNVAGGSAFYMYLGGGIGSLTIEDSEITGGTRSIDLYRVAHSIIRRSLITGGTTGVYIRGPSASNLATALIENSRISDVSLHGVHVAPDANVTLHYNDLFNIAGYTVNNQTPYDIDAADNYWGEDTETEMNAKGCDANIDTIYDRYDSGTKGLVTYCDYATDPFGDQPTIFFADNAGQDEIHWNPKADLTYDLIRGDLANLTPMGGIVDLGPVTCEQQVDGSGSIIDGSPDPAPWQGWFFLMRDHVTPGNYGLDSSGRERIPASGDCP